MTHREIESYKFKIGDKIKYYFPNIFTIGKIFDYYWQKRKYYYIIETMDKQYVIEKSWIETFGILL
jgi:hypothetical protein